MLREQHSNMQWEHEAALEQSRCQMRHAEENARHVEVHRQEAEDDDLLREAMDGGGMEANMGGMDFLFMPERS